MHTFGDVGGQNLLNSGVGQLVYLFTLQWILCPTAESRGGTVHLKKGGKKEENLGKPRKAIIYLFV